MMGKYTVKIKLRKIYCCKGKKTENVASLIWVLVKLIVIGTNEVRCRTRTDKVKVKLSKHHAMNAYWRNGCIAPVIL
jgi:hypothetical protein